MAGKSVCNSNYLTTCLCKLQLPHSEEHVNAFPKQIMPTLQLKADKYTAFEWEQEQKKRVQDLLADIDAARAEDLQLQRKFEKDAKELLDAYKKVVYVHFNWESSNYVKACFNQAVPCLKPREKCDHWVPLELEDSGMEESTARLKYELDHSRFQLAEVRNQLHTLKREVAAYEKLVRQEIGENVNLHEVLTSDKWRGRAQEIKRLKAEIATMESKAYDHKYMKNPLCIPTYKPRFPDVNDLIPKGQLKALQNEVRKKRELRDKTEKEVSALIEQYGNISLMYKASLRHNKMLAEELRSLKEQHAKYDARAKEDQDLIKHLIAHQMQMREMINREAHLAKLVKKKQNEEMDLEQEDTLDAVKYKALWEASESEKCYLDRMVQMLTKRLDDIVEVAEEAEKHCADNETRRQEIEQEVEAQKSASQQTAKLLKNSYLSMVKWSLWSYVFILTTLAVSSSNLHTGLGMKIQPRPKRQPSDAEDVRQMVTIDLSALRPSLPGLVLYKYGEAAPKLVQIDLSALNPQLQPHVIWPQFDQLELLNDRSFDFDNMDAIPYLTEEESFITPKHQRMAKMSVTDADSWPDMDDLTDSDIYDFIPDSRRNDELMSLQGSLPLAEEVIVPLDWEEEKVNRNSAKRNGYASKEWHESEQKGATENTNTANSKSEKATRDNAYNVHYTPFGTANWMSGKKKQGRETESEEMKDETVKTPVGQPGKKNVFISSGWGPGGQQVSVAGVRRQGTGTGRIYDNKPQSQPVRIPSQESWSVPRQYWNVPHLLGGNWQ